MGEIKHQTNLLIKHVPVEALWTQQGDMTFEQSLFGLGNLQIDFCLGGLTLERNQGHDPPFALDRVISEIDDRAHAKKRWKGTPGSPEKITQIPHDLK